MPKKISFLLGAGFSRPAGYPTASQLSKKIEAKIMSFSACEEQSTERKLWAFYEFVKSLGNEAGFDYEWFYDCIFVARKNFSASENCEDVFNCNEQKPLCNCFAKQLKAKGIAYDDISPMRELYSLIIADLLYVDECMNSDVECYREFVSFLSDIKANCTAVEIYSLNHDLLLERLLKDGHLEYADGYAYPNPDKVIFYKNVADPQGKVPAEVFGPHNFNSQINLCKLHGSLDTYWIGDVIMDDNDLGYECSVKVNSCCQVPPDFSRWRLSVDSSRPIFEKSMASVSWHPDFLTGKESKLRDYATKHYAVMFDRFLGNICQSDAIIVVGYGFGDFGINMILQQSQPNCKIVAICGDKANVKASDVFSKNFQGDSCKREIRMISRLEDVVFDNVKSFLNIGL